MKRKKRNPIGSIGFALIFPLLITVSVHAGDWIWQNPLQQGHNLRAVWGSSGTDVFAVGDESTILHYNGSVWTAMPSPPTGNNLYGVWGSSGTDVFVVGGAGRLPGVILRYNGSIWTNLDTTNIDTNNRPLLAVWGSSGNDVFAVGYVALHYNGNAWTSSQTGGPFNGVWGSSGTDVFAVGSGYNILHYTGSSWTLMPPPAYVNINDLYGVGGSSGSDVFAVGSFGTILHYDGIAWTTMPSGTTNNLNGVWGSSGGDVFVVGDGGVTGTFSVPLLVFSPAYLRFLNQEVGTTSPAQIITLSNNGTAPLGISGISASGDFAQTNTCGATLPVGSSCSVDVAFAPTANGIRKGKVSVTSDAPGSPHSEPLLGIGGLVLPPQAYGIFRQGAWYFDRDRSEDWSGCGADACYASFGLPTDVPITGDWTGTGMTRIGVFREGQWFLDLNGNGSWDGCGADACYASFGLPTDVPITGDWTGTGMTRIGVFREGQWFLDLNGNGSWDGCGADACYASFGLPTDVPITGDWTGTGMTRIGVFREGQWFLDLNGNGFWDGCDVDQCLGPYGGLSNDVPVVGDWTGEAISKIGIYREGSWYLDRNGNGLWDGCGTDTCSPDFGGFSADKPVIE